MKVINLGAKNSVLNKFMAELRDENIQKNRMRFRENIKRIGHIEAYEISKLLDYSNKTINTPLAPCEVSTHDNDIVLATVQACHYMRLFLMFLTKLATVSSPPIAIT